MWDATLFSKKRAGYEKQANAAAKRLEACRKALRKGGKKGKAKDGFGKEWGSPAEMWASTPSTRPISAIGTFQQITSPNGSTDAILSVATGHRPGVFTPLEDRCTLLGGIAALHAAGYNYPNPDKAGIKAVFGTKTPYDAKIVNAAKLKGSVASAAAQMRKLVAAKNLGEAAWGFRVIYLFSTLPGLQAVQGTITGLMALIPIVGPIISGIEAGHIGISTALVKAYAKKAEGYIKSGLQKGKRRDSAGGGAGAGAGGGASTSPSAVASVNTSPWWLWAAGGVAVVGVAAIVRRNRRAS